MAHDSAPTSTKDSILNAAERLFARHGHDGTSMRQITHAAGVNLAAINYHFGSKDALIQAVFQRRLQALDHERMQRLDALQAQAAGQALKPSQIVEAYFGPLVRHACRQGGASPAFVPLVERSMSDPNGFIRTLFAQEHASVFARFRLALLDALPGVPETLIMLRFHFMLGATSHAIMGADTLRAVLGLPENPAPPALDTEQLTQHLMHFLLGGLRAPLPASPISCTHAARPLPDDRAMAHNAVRASETTP